MATEERLTAKIFDWFITTKCTMNCKLCAAAVPHIKNPRHTPRDIAIRELHEFFRVWDYAERVELIGGEPLMYPDLDVLIREALCYSDRFDRMRITTNATIVPTDELCALIAGCGKEFDFVIDDYGELSKNLRPLVEKLDKYAIPYRVDKYHGEEQRFGGWIYFGDYTLINDELGARQTFLNCICPKNQFVCVNHGRAFSCVYAMCMYWIRDLFPGDGSCVDLFNEGVSLEEKRCMASCFCQSPIGACRYCHGFDAQSGRRYPGPPEQMPRRL